MRSSRFTGAVASAFLALALGAGVTGATMSNQGSAAKQFGSNHNQTSQDAKTSSETAQGNLNAPWGLVIAPKRFGGFGGDLLVVNFGDGKINAPGEQCRAAPLSLSAPMPLCQPPPASRFCVPGCS